VGEGILKQKLHQWLRKNQYSFFDAPFKLYGEGATRVELKRKGKLL
jgi:DNA-nicking Smr family endonuclease